MMIVRFLASLVFWCVATASLASEQINDFAVSIEVQQDGDILVTENISVTSEGNQIRRGIFRDLPRFFEQNGARLPFRYNVQRITRDGRKEPYDISTEGNAYRIRIGDADVFLDHGEHAYEIRYEVKNQIRYFDAYDEIYWNATGSYWALPIARASAEVILPGGAPARQAVAFTGSFGADGADYRYRHETGGAHVFTTTRRLQPREGLTVAVGFDKGIVDPPSDADRRANWWAANGAAAMLSLGALGLLGYYLFAFNRAGRDPVKGPVFPHYEAPEGYSPTGVHHIYYRRLSGHNALIASLINLGVSNRLKIDRDGRKKTTLTRLPDSEATQEAFPIEQQFLDDLLAVGEQRTIGGSTDTKFTKAYRKFQTESAKRFGRPYFKWNIGFLIIGLIISGAALSLAMRFQAAWHLWHFVALGALIGLNLLFAYLMPAPTYIGQKLRTQIEGFRLYLKTAERLQLNAVDIDGKSPPPMTTERYERFLPYAIALRVEKPWTRHFERALPEVARDYNPRWSRMGRGNYNSLHGLNSALVSSMSSGVSSALPQSSSSSGSGGGGSSGGGGGGGGGGGW